jgi:hypothetical protein
MNNTKKTRTLAMFAVLTAATLVVGTFAITTTTAQSAFAYMKKGPQDNKKVARDDGKGNNNGNTITIQKCKQAATQSGWDNNQEQECANLICTHPGENATCVQKGVTSTTTPTPTPTTIQVSGQGEGQNVCPKATVLNPASITFSVQQSGNAATQGQFEIAVQTIRGSFTKTGTLDSVQITGNSFTITGTELSAGNEVIRCEDILVPPTATITGQCGTGVAIQFATADGERATFTGNVECTTT